jgi:hypothetical protein
VSTPPDWLQQLVNRPDRAAAVIELARLFLAAAATQRELVRAGWPFGAAWPYPDPARLGCDRGETAPARERIVASLALEYLEGVFGSREHLIVLSATYRACELAGLDPTTVFEQVAGALDASGACWLRSFLSRSKSDREPSAFGLVERSNEDGEVEIHFQQ